METLLHEGLAASVLRVPDKIAVIAEGESYTYKELFSSITRLSNSLKDNNFNRGDRCVIYMDNTISCVISIYAVLLAGGIFVLVNPQTKRDKLEFVLNDSSARVLISDSRLYDKFSHINRDVESLMYIISTGDIAFLSDSSVKSFYDVINGSTGTGATKKTDIAATDLAALIYTSGSTGHPKGVMQTHFSMSFTLNSLIEYLRLSGEDRILLVLPLAFDYGLYQLLMSVQLGATLVLERSFTYPEQIFKVIEEASITVFPGVPTIFSILLSFHKRNKMVFPNIARITNTAAALPTDYIDTLKEIFPSALIFNMYGLTECKRVSYLEPEKILDKPASVGRAIPGTEVFLLDEEGNDVPLGHTGMLYVKGPHIMRGYWNQKELSDEVLIDTMLADEKILCTKDWFKMDKDGDLYFQGRNDDIIKSRGEKVSPVEIENVIHSIKGVFEVVVVGEPDDVLGEAISCFIVLEKNANLSAMDVKKACVDQLENFMVPKYIAMVPELPKTNTGKISTRGLFGHKDKGGA